MPRPVSDICSYLSRQNIPQGIAFPGLDCSLTCLVQIDFSTQLRGIDQLVKGNIAIALCS